MTLDSLNCPHCGKTVWVNLGNINDLTVSDVDGAICPYCGTKFLWPDTDEWDDPEYTQGYKTPNEAAGVKP